MRERLKELLGKVLGSGILIFLVLGIPAALALVSGTLMGLLGFRYESVGSLLLFFLLTALVSFPIEVAAAALPRALVSLGWLPQGGGLVLYAALDVLATVLSMSLMDGWMDSVSATATSILVLALLCTVTSLKDFQRKLDRDRERRP